MKAIVADANGDLQFADIPIPSCSDDQILVEVIATAVNRADLLQRQGKYPPPEGVTEVLGLEAAGVVKAKGKNVSEWNIDDRVFGILSGGGYAEFTLMDKDVAMPIPENLSFLQAAAVPEVFYTAFQALHLIADASIARTILIHAGASGVGSAAIQLAKAAGAEVLVTASKGKHRFCTSLGADLCIEYKSTDFVKAVRDFTNGRGVDILIDFIGGPYFFDNCRCMALDGQFIMLGLLGGVESGVGNIGHVVSKRITISGSTLRNRPISYKRQLARRFQQKVLPLLKLGTVKPVVDKIFSWQEVEKAHRYMEENRNRGKLIIRIK